MSAVNDDDAPVLGGRVAALAAVALTTTVTSVLAAPGAPGLCGALLALIVLAIADTDARAGIIPDGMNAAALLLGLAHVAAVQDGHDTFAAFGEGLLRAVIAAGVFWLIRNLYKRARGRDGLGLGDVKLAAVAGIWLDWPSIAIATEIAALSAIAFYVGRSLIRRQPMSGANVLPFGLFLAPAIWLGWLGERLSGYLTG